MRPHRIALAALFPVATAAAQPAPSPAAAPSVPRAVEPPARPAFQSLRYEERWPAGSPGDRLKHLELTPDGRLFLTVGGQLRARGERVTHYLAETGSDRSDAYGGTRLLVSADLWWTTRFRGFVEARDAVGHDRELPGGRRTSDHDRWDYQNAFVEGRATIAGATVGARVGRQELQLGRERLLGPSDWGNARRTFDGARATLSRGALAVDLFSTRPVLVRSSAGNRADSLTRFHGLLLSGKARASGRWQGYLLLLEQDSTRFAGRSGSHRRTTAGLRAEGGLPAVGGLAFAWEGEGALQRGTLAEAPVRAWFWTGELTARAPRVAWRPSLAAGVDVASGDTDPTDRRAGTFHQLFPSAHTHGGYADVIGRQNARELRLVATAGPVAPLALRAAVHRFDRQATTDAAYAKSGAALRSGASGARHLGTETDLTATWQMGRHLRLLAGYAHYAPGRYLHETTGGAHPIDWGFVGTTLTF
ncbi:MAG TPA: alginate export family protein [Gemmatimonadaceae bacterium]|nr:alginate export family protein [Gemmatimonadaceae bacterium]